MNDKNTDDTETVHIARANTRSVYHTDADCESMPEPARQVARDVAESHFGLTECAYCAGTFETQGHNQYDTFPELHSEHDAPVLED